MIDGKTYLSLPPDFIKIDLTKSLFGDNPCPKATGPAFIINEKLEIQEVKAGSVFLPRLCLQVHIKDINKDNIESKYEEYQTAMLQKRLLLLNKLVQTTKTGKGLYYDIFWMSQTCDTGGMVFSEEFSAIWSAHRIINYVDTLYTNHVTEEMVMEHLKEEN